MDTSSIIAIERDLLDQATQPFSPRPIFILGAPRSGSTFLFQAIAGAFGLPYISNITNNLFASYPIVGMALQRGVVVQITYQSSFGKTKGGFQPSEGSAVMARWFGGAHPSQDASAHILDGQENHFLTTLAAVEALYDGRPLLIKNAWNCFRIPYLASTLPKARFVWIRRDIAESAESDLEARYLTKGSASAWNSATPSNWKALQKLPPHQQVIENQIEFNCAIQKAALNDAKGRVLEIWHEDVVRLPEIELQKISAFLGLDFKSPALSPRVASERQRKLPAFESSAIHDYLDDQSVRFSPHRYLTHGA